MYVCVCNAVTERDIGTALASGCGSLRELREQLGVGACCGRCTGCARDLLRKSSPLPLTAIPRPLTTRPMLAAT